MRGRPCAATRTGDEAAATEARAPVGVLEFRIQGSGKMTFCSPFFCGREPVA